MSNYALIKSGVVENIVVWDGKDNIFSDYDIVNIDDTDAGIGWSYSDGQFHAPAAAEKTQEEYIKIAEAERNARIVQANEHMNSKQWPGKAAMGRLKDSEKDQYNAWLDYLDALETVNTSSAPDVSWPALPQA